MEELYVYNLEDNNLYFNASRDFTIKARDLHSNKQYLISHKNILNDTRNRNVSAPTIISRIILLSETVRSKNILINVSIPFYSKTILNTMAANFDKIYLLSSCPARQNYGATFSIIMPLIHTLHTTMQYVRDLIFRSISENFMVVRSNFVHILKSSRDYEAVLF